MSFQWGSDLDAAKGKMAAEKLGGFIWFYSETDDAESEEAKRVQHEVFFNPLVRKYGNQLEPLRLKREDHVEDSQTGPGREVIGDQRADVPPLVASGAMRARASSTSGPALSMST